MQTRATGVVTTAKTDSTVSEVWNPIKLAAAQANRPGVGRGSWVANRIRRTSPLERGDRPK